MEILEAIEKLNNFKNYVNCGLLSNALLSDTQQAIDTILNELDNRIPIKDIEDIYNELKKVYEDELNRLGMTMKGSALDVLEYILNKYKE